MLRATEMQTEDAHAAGPGGPVLLFDGHCAFCAASVRFVLRHERRQTLRFAPLDGSYGRALIASHPEMAQADSMIWFERGSGGASDVIVTHSAAAVRVARYLGGLWQLAGILLILPRALRDAGYRRIATHRHRLMRESEDCLIPTPQTAQRFLP